MNISFESIETTRFLTKGTESNKGRGLLVRWTSP